MNCKEAQMLIAGLTGDEIPDALGAHIEHCPACANLLAVDLRLRTTLRSSRHAASPQVLDRIRMEIATPVGNSWTEILKGSKLMKIYIPAAAIAALALALIPRSANATAAATFAKMKTAVLAKAKQQTQTSLELKVMQKPDGSIGSWVVLDGQLTEIPMNSSIDLSKDGKQIHISSSLGTDMSNLPPELQAQIQAALKTPLAGGNADGSIKHVYIVNGKQVDAATLNKALHSVGVDLKMSIDLNELHYQSIMFGNDHNHLVLMPKAAEGKRYLVTLDPKSNLPLNVTLQKAVKGSWVAMKESNVTFR